MKTKQFKISKVLQWQPQKEIDPLKIKELTVDGDYSYPFYGQATINNGIISFETLTSNVLNNKDGKPTILVHSNNQNIVYLETPFYLKDGHGATSVLQSDMLNEKNALYIIACIKKVIAKKFAYNEKATKIALKNTFIELPVTDDGEIDYNFMEISIRKLEEDCICELEEERTCELTAYLSASNLDNYSLTNSESLSLQSYLSHKIEYKPFKLGEGKYRLFDIKSPKRRFNANAVTFGGKYPYVVRSSTNNGIRGYITEDTQYLSAGKTISFGQDTATIFYQEKPYFTGDKIKVMTYRDCELYPELACYLLATMRKAFQSFAWGQSSFNETILKNIEISLPVKSDGKIDYNFITTFIRVQEKLSIKNVVDWKDRVISTTKECVYNK
ncbi:MAG: restriction endonuclease subunit S [Butyrivibrio sp.]|nr:restriction endonuclease subunit S [Butyrivibrio sp.]